VSRSGDECVVALTDQWYLEYGEEQWRARAEKCLAGMNTYHDEARRAFESTLGWLRQWACSRSFGLGTRVPWDAEFLIESLSDSTIYMAYYTVAHLLQGGDMYGKARPSVTPEQMTDDVWDAVFLGKPLDSVGDNGFPAALLAEMKAEFEFWYPFDLRVSGKDLIQNHLTFAIYNHAAIWEHDETKWPRSFRTNGHLLLNNEKMSKSTGNFKTLKQSIEEYSSDAMRFALADAGDTIEDANFVDDTANAAILRLTKELVWIEEMLAICESADARRGPSDGFADRVFANAMDVAIEAARSHYEKMMFRDALKSGFYDLQSARDAYRVICGGDKHMHADLALRFIEVSTLLLTPFCPHTCEHIWGALLKKSGTVTKAGFPIGAAPDAVLASAARYLDETCASVRKGVAKACAPPKKKGGGATGAPKVCRAANVFVAGAFAGWRATCLAILREKFDAAAVAFPPAAEILDAVKSSELARSADFKNVMKQVMPFVKFKMTEAQAIGAGALNDTLAFDETAILTENVEHIMKVCDLREVRVLAAEDASEARAAAEKDGQKVDQATPGDPTWHYLVEEDIAVKVEDMDISK
jgi:leucyl-tRNA synthetase